MAPPLTTLSRTAVVAWSPTPSHSPSPSRSLESPRPYLATGTVSGALDDSFSSESHLELWAPFDTLAHPEPICRVNAPARFNRIAWGPHGTTNGDRPLGVIAGGLENGTVALWDPSLALDNPRHE